MNFEPERADVSVFLERWEDMEIEPKEPKASTEKAKELKATEAAEDEAKGPKGIQRDPKGIPKGFF